MIALQPDILTPTVCSSIQGLSHWEKVITSPPWVIILFSRSFLPCFLFTDYTCSTYMFMDMSSMGQSGDDPLICLHTLFIHQPLFHPSYLSVLHIFLSSFNVFIYHYNRVFSDSKSETKLSALCFYATSTIWLPLSQNF